jgi:sugar lactone lactonase YvrE
MKWSILLLLSSLLIIGCSSKKQIRKERALIDKKTIGILPTEKQPELNEVAQFKGAQVTGVTFSDDGRLFANFPRWRENVPFSVVEVLPDGTSKPYPNEKWNAWNGKPEKNQFTCVQSVLAHNKSLFVLDPSSPEMKGVIGNAKLYQFDLATNKLIKTWEFDKKVAPEKSYLNDLRVDDKTNNIYITDSGLGGIVVLDMKSGKARRLLDKHPSTKSEEITLIIEEEKFKQDIHSDGIAISPIDNKLYYHALNGYTLYRVPVKALDKTKRNETQLVKKVENLGVTPAPDGMIFDEEGNLYMADLERNAISYRTPNGDLKILIQDERIKWADSFTIDDKRNLIFTDSLLQKASIGKPVDDMTFKIYKVSLPQTKL